MSEARFETPVGEDRAVRWEEGTLLWPAPGRGCRCLDVARELLIEFEGVGRKQLLHSFVEDE